MLWETVAAGSGGGCGGGPIQGNLSILSMRGWGEHHWRHIRVHTEQYKHLKTTKGSQFKVTGSSSIKPGRMFCPEGQLVSLGTTRKESLRQLWQCLSDGLPGKDGIRAVGPEPPSPISGLSWGHMGPQQPVPLSHWILFSAQWATFWLISCPQSGTQGEIPRPVWEAGFGPPD